jgi:hypothetical protein
LTEFPLNWKADIFRRIRDRASYLVQARAIGRQALIVVGFNALLWMLLVASGAMATPMARGSPIVLGVGFASALIIPIAKIGFDITRGRLREFGLYAGLIGTMFLWGPIYLLTMFGEQPGIVMDLTYVGAGLLLVSVLWPTPSTPKSSGQ